MQTSLFALLLDFDAHLVVVHSPLKELRVEIAFCLVYFHKRQLLIPVLKLFHEVEVNVSEKLVLHYFSDSPIFAAQSFFRVFLQQPQKQILEVRSHAL